MQHLLVYIYADTTASHDKGDTASLSHGTMTGLLFSSALCKSLVIRVDNGRLHGIVLFCPTMNQYSPNFSTNICVDSADFIVAESN